MVASNTAAAFAGHIKALVRMNIFKLLPKALTNRSESIARDIYIVMVACVLSSSLESKWSMSGSF